MSNSLPALYQRFGSEFMPYFGSIIPPIYHGLSQIDPSRPYIEHPAKRRSQSQPAQHAMIKINSSGIQIKEENNYHATGASTWPPVLAAALTSPQRPQEPGIVGGIAVGGAIF